MHESGTLKKKQNWKVSESLEKLLPLKFSRLDKQKVGQHLYPKHFKQIQQTGDLIGKYGQDRDWYNVNRTGADNSGHDFWPLIKTDQNRLALIEYLKTL